MVGEYIPSGQGTVDTIRLRDGRTVRVSAVDGRSNPLGEYIPSGQGTVNTIHLQDGGTVQVSAVDGRSNPHCHCAHARSNGKMPWWWEYAMLGTIFTVVVGIPFGIGYAVGASKFKNK